MAKAPYGPWGPVSGKVGNLVYFIVNGRQRIRTIGKVTVPPSEAQLRVRQEMKVVAAFLKLITEYVNIGFMTVARGSKSPYNMATSYNKLHALKGNYPDITIDFSKVMVSMGKLFSVLDPSVVLSDTGLVFSWNGAYPLGYNNATDQTLVLAFFPEENRAVYGLYGARRSDGTALLALPEDLRTQPMEIYLSMVSVDRKQVSDSLYLGRLNEPIR